MSLVISTAWNAFRSSDAERMIYELKDLGFSEVELSFNLTSGMVDAIQALVDRGTISVSSVHNFCPIPEGLKREEALPDFFSMSSPDESQRQRSVENTKRSIDTAVRLNARAVVLHCGRVEMNDAFRQLCGAYNREGPGSALFKSLKEEMLRQREGLAPRYFGNTLRSLEELNRYAQERKVLLGVETRYYYTEIPTRAELGVILGTFKGGAIRYWHDVGHAQVAENLGLETQEGFLEPFKDSLLGMHLHDVVGTGDHKSPSAGAVDFSRLTPFLTPRTIKVMEVHHPAGPQDLIRGREFLTMVFDGKA